MYLLCMIKARIRWCTCRVENILTLGKLLSLWFCFLLHSILFLISQTSYRTYKIISSYELARPIMGTIFLVKFGQSTECRYCSFTTKPILASLKVQSRHIAVQSRHIAVLYHTGLIHENNFSPPSLLLLWLQQCLVRYCTKQDRYRKVIPARLRYL